MSIETWLRANGASLAGKTVVLTGATGGLGAEACRYILSCSGKLVTVTRNPQKTEALCKALRDEFPGSQIQCLYADFSDIQQMKTLSDSLRDLPVDILILNAGAYAIPREICSTGYDNVFQINFVSHYYLVRRLLPLLIQRKSKVVAVGSIAHSGCPSDPQDIDFASHEGAEKIYGNSKRYLMFSLMELLKDYPEVRFAIGHPGISLTGITNSYPKAILPFVKFSMRILFMPPRLAVRSIVKAIFTDVPYLHWIGPKCKNIWGAPEIKALSTCESEERQAILARAERIYENLPQ